MRLLLDTHALLWWLANAPALGRDAIEAISAPENDVYLSVASAWEIAIKISIGRLRFPLEALESELAVNDFRMLSIRVSHLEQLLGLPWHHRDPFDRLLVAQALHEGMVIVTRDPHIPRYGVRTLGA